METDFATTESATRQADGVRKRKEGRLQDRYGDLLSPSTPRRAPSSLCRWRQAGHARTSFSAVLQAADQQCRRAVCGMAGGKEKDRLEDALREELPEDIRARLDAKRPERRLGKALAKCGKAMQATQQQVARCRAGMTQNTCNFERSKARTTCFCRRSCATCILSVEASSLS